MGTKRSKKDNKVVIDKSLSSLATPFDLHFTKLNKHRRTLLTSEGGGDGPVDSVDISTYNWVQAGVGVDRPKALPVVSEEELDGPSFIVHAGKIWVLGGVSTLQDYEMISSVKSYNISTNTWTDELPLEFTTVGYGYRGVGHGDWLYLTGFDFDYNNIFFRHNTLTGITEMLPSPGGPDFGGFELSKLEGSSDIYMAIYSNNASKRFNIDTLTWHTGVTPNPSSYSETGGYNGYSTQYKNELVCTYAPNPVSLPLGGDPDWEHNTGLSTYSPGLNSWRTLPELPIPALSSTIFVIDDRLYAFGGISQKTALDTYTMDRTLYRLAEDELSWEEIANKELPTTIAGLGYVDTDPWPVTFAHGVVDNKFFMIESWRYTPPVPEEGAIAFAPW